MPIKKILSQCSVENTLVKLPPMQLERCDYLEVKNALELIGGKWKGGKTQGFIFNEDPTEYLAQLCQGEKINLKKEFQFFATPDELAENMVKKADIAFGNRILEPSAGQGAIINAIYRMHPKQRQIDCCELMPLNKSFLEKIDGVSLIADDFLSLGHEFNCYYNRIIANPPFSKNQDIDHIRKMYNCLKNGGKLVSIMSNHWRESNGNKEKSFQQFINFVGAQIYEIEAGAFKESGTNVSACIVVIDKDTDIVPPIEDTSTETKKPVKPQPKPTKQLPPKPDNSLKQFEDSFNSFAYQFGQAEVFVDFLDYVLLVTKWWEPDRDFSYFEKKYKKIFDKFPNMLTLLAIASDDMGEGFRDALGDLFMDLVSHGHNGQFFTPDNICQMMSMMTIPELSDGQNVLDCACGSGRMLLAAGKRNRNVFLFGNDIDSTCCKMAVVNLLLNTLQGEIAQMNALTMEYTKSWEVSYRNCNGMNMPVYRVITDKEESVFWKMHMNAFNHAETEPVPIEPEQVLQILIPEMKSQKHTQLQLF